MDKVCKGVDASRTHENICCEKNKTKQNKKTPDKKEKKRVKSFLKVFKDTSKSYKLSFLTFSIDLECVLMTM
jgi:hypothetical protein